MLAKINDDIAKELSTDDALKEACASLTQIQAKINNALNESDRSELSSQLMDALGLVFFIANKNNIDMKTFFQEASKERDKHTFISALKQD